MDNLKSIIDNKEFKNSYIEDIFNFASNILFVVDSDDEIILANNAFFDFFNQYETLIEFKKNHKSICEFFSQDKQFKYVVCDMDGQHWIEYILEYSILTQYVKIINNDKEYIFNIKATKIDQDIDNESGHYIVTLTDVTQLIEYKRKLEIEVKEKTIILEAQYELMAENEKFASLGSLVAGVAHEINTPIGIALTASSFLTNETKKLKKDYDNDTLDEDDFRDYLQNIQETSESIEISLQKSANLINSFKQVSVDQSSNENRKINLKEYIDEILLSLHAKLKNSSHKIDVNIAQDISLDTNPGAISQIITNFITNSLIHGFKDMDNGIITINATLNNNILTLIYKDNGVGICDDVKKKIYDPFFTTNRSEGGSGLGMNIVYNLVVAKLNGRIEVNSILGDGVEFIVKVKGK